MANHSDSDDGGSGGDDDFHRREYVSPSEAPSEGRNDEKFVRKRENTTVSRACAISFSSLRCLQKQIPQSPFLASSFTTGLISTSAAMASMPNVCYNTPNRMALAVPQQEAREEPLQFPLPRPFSQRHLAVWSVTPPHHKLKADHSKCSKPGHQVALTTLGQLMTDWKIEIRNINVGIPEKSVCPNVFSVKRILKSCWRNSQGPQRRWPVVWQVPSRGGGGQASTRRMPGVEGERGAPPLDHHAGMSIPGT